jgi:hypothetical protein
MLLTKKLIVNLGSATIKYYKDLGYEIPKFTSRKTWFLEIDVKDLPRTSATLVEVSCEGCDSIRKVRYRDLTRGRKSKWGKDGFTYCKNCAKKIRWGNPLFVQYKQNANKRNLSFELTEEQFNNINSNPCHYCGGMNEYVRLSHKGNGIDRKNNSIGYTLENSVPCCTICNRAKRDMDYEDFIKYIKRLRNAETL